MKKKLIKEKQQFTKVTTPNANPFILRPFGIFGFPVMIVTLGLLMSQVNAGLPLDDIELDSKYIEQKYSETENALFSGIFNSVRLLGGTEIFGVPAGVSNTGSPLAFGSENYSTKWAGNLAQIYKPTVNASGVLAPYSVYDTSDIGFGFRAETHFAQEIRPTTIQLIIDTNR